MDVERNLRSPLAGIANMARRQGVKFHEPTISVRTGDTPQRDRARYLRDPSDILITTPESLYLMLTSQSAEALRTVDTIITLKHASGCAINITGGTEVGHASGTYSHYNGYKVDISHNSCIDGYIKNDFTYIGYRGDGYPQWKAASGNLYCDEGNHWDITVY